MKQDCCQPPHPLVRDGVNQEQRSLPMLSPAAIKIDDRQIQDLMIWAKEYAKEMAFYDQDNRLTGHWQQLVDRNPAMLISVISLYNTASQRSQFNIQKNALENASNDAERLEEYKKLCEHLVSLTALVYGWYEKSRPDLSLYRILKQAIKADLAPAMVRLQSYDLGAKDTLGAELKLNYGTLTQNNDLWPLGTAIKRIDIYKGANQQEKLENAMQSIESLFSLIYRVVVRLVHDAPKLIPEIMSWPNHEPHMALYIAFLKLFGLLQADMNKLTQRHLDFYYKNVLRLGLKEAIADQAHLIFKLSPKRIQPFNLAKGVEFTAGKDVSGNLIHYGVLKDTALNQAEITDIKALYIDRQSAKDATTIYESPYANSADGQGGDFEDPDTARWKTFGHSTDRNKAKTGLVIATPTLELAEGNRIITLTFSFSRKVKINNAQKLFSFYLSTADAWYQCSEQEAVCRINDKSDTLTVSITLGKDAPAITTFSPETELGVFDSKWPLLKIEAKETAQNYDILSKTEISSLKVSVSVKDMRNLILSNDQGPVPADKPVPVFGTIPKNGSSFMIGAQEALQKNLEEFKVTFDWQDVPNLRSHYEGYYQSALKGTVTQKTDIKTLKSGIERSLAQYMKQTRIGRGKGKEIKAIASIPNVIGGYLSSIDDDKITPAEMRDTLIRLVEKLEPKDKNSLQQTQQLKNIKATISSYFSGKIQTYQGISNDNITCSVELLDKSQPSGWKMLSTGHKILVAGQDKSYSLKEPDLNGDAQGQNDRWSRLAGEEKFESYSHDLKRGFIRVNLNADLLHENYTNIYAQIAIKLAQKDDGTLVLPNAPYTPIAKAVSLDYKATDSNILSTLGADGSIDQLFHLYPFGHKEVKQSTPTLLPSFTHEVRDEDDPDQQSTFVTTAGELYIGLKNTPQDGNRYNLSILFQISEGTADPSVEIPPDIIWSYLKGDEWALFEKQDILEDDTKKFVRPGIITLNMPKDADEDHTILPKDHVWIRASVKENPQAICDLINLHAQAAKIAFIDKNNDPSHLETDLPAETISKMINRDSAISEFIQPYASFNGQIKEQSQYYYRRVSERLRHKNRAVSIWDYERLVLEHMPNIYKVKCLSHTAENYDNKGDIKDYELYGGHVSIVIIPKVIHKTGIDLREPLASQSMKTEVAEILGARVPRSIKNNIRILNPIYEQISTLFDVVFEEGEDEGLSIERLKKDIVKYLSPWAYEEGVDISFGGRIHASAIVDFINERSYVDTVHDFRMFQTFNGQKREVSEALTHSARSILVAAREQDHEIKGVSHGCNS